MAAVTKVGKTNEVESAKIMLNDCWLGGSEAVKSDVVLFMEATKRFSRFLVWITSLMYNHNLVTNIAKIVRSTGREAYK